MALPVLVLALLVAFISGSIIMNSLITELPSEKDGRFLPFLAGGLTIRGDPAAAGLDGSFITAATPAVLECGANRAACHG